jgi:3-deoxy-D-manno-octulosonic-acid transferase
VKHSAALPWTLRGYLAAASVAGPLWRWALRRRLARGKETPASVAQKLMRDPGPPPPAGPLVWGHAVGVGEAQALAGLFRRLAERLPQHQFLITTSARTSAEAFSGTGLPPRCQHRFAPVDHPPTVRAFLRHWQPRLAIWCEMDLWPATLLLAEQHGMPLVLVNARMTLATAQRRARGGQAYARLLQVFSALAVQNPESAQALQRLGVPASRLQVTGTIKAMAPAPGHQPEELARLQQAVGSRPLWLLASSHPGEEALALQAHALLLTTHPYALLIVAPRAPGRSAEIAALCPAGTPVRSRGEGPSRSQAIYLADTIGDMGLWYRLAPVALVGGSLAEIGGHNPYEPQALACQVLHGPHVGNFAESYAQLDAQGTAKPVHDAQEVAEAVRLAWSQPRATPAADGVTADMKALLDSLCGLAQRPA